MSEAFLLVGQGDVGPSLGVLGSITIGETAYDCT